MGGKKATVGYRYELGLQFGIAKGADALLAVEAGDRVAWQGELTSNGSIQINAPDLFGGDDREGGIQGQLDVMFGEPDQAPNDYLAAQQGTPQPAYRGFFGAVFRRGLVTAINPYIKPWAFRYRRILSGWHGGEAWYPEKAEIVVADAQELPASGFATFDPADIVGSAELDDGGRTFYATGPSPTVSGQEYKRVRANAPKLSGAYYVEFYNGTPVAPVTDESRSSIRVGLYRKGFAMTQESGAIDSVGGFEIGFRSTAGNNTRGFYYKAGVDFLGVAVPSETPPEWVGLAFRIEDEYTVRAWVIVDGEWAGSPSLSSPSGKNPLTDPDGTPQLLSSVGSTLSLGGWVPSACLRNPRSENASFQIEANFGQGAFRIGDAAFAPGGVLEGFTKGLPANGTVIGGRKGMNPAHIIYQCITDPEWGMGYPAAVIDDANFRAAADTLHAEGFGLCGKWNRQTSVEEFVGIICDTVGMNLVQDRRTGLFQLILLRADYAIESLPVIGPHNAKLVRYERPSLADTVNEVLVRYKEVETGKEAAVPPMHNMANIQGQGRVVSQTLRYDLVPTFALAARIAQRDLLARSTPLWRFDIEMDRSGGNFVPGKPYLLDWPAPLNIRAVIRPGEIDYGRIEDGKVLIKAVEDVFSLPATAILAEQPSGWVPPDTAPRPVRLPAVFEASYRDLVLELPTAERQALADDAGFVGAAAARPASVATNFALHTRVAPAEFEGAGNGDFVPGAVLAEPCAPWDVVVTVEDGIDLSAASPGAAVLIGTWPDIEVARLDAVDLEAGTLTLGRGCADTVANPAGWPAGTPLLVYADIGAFDPAEYVDGETVDARLLTQAPGGVLSLGLAANLPVTMASRQARPYPPARIRINGAAWPSALFGELELTGAHRDRLLQADQLVDQEEADVGPEPGTTYRVRWYIDDALEREETGLSAPADTWTPTAEGLVRVEVEAVRDGLASWQRQVREFAWTADEVVSSLRITDAADTRITDSGDRRITD